MELSAIRELIRLSSKKIVLLVLDGLGGLPIKPNSQTELEAANTPVMDKLAAEGVLGLSTPIAPGVTPGSGPAHLALFGYDPLKFIVGRGVLEATGIGIKIAKGDIAARGNFCTIDAAGLITDRRAGRISSDLAEPIVDRLNSIAIAGFQVEVRHVREYRFAAVLRGSSYRPELEDTDPQHIGLAPLKVQAKEPAAEETAQIFNKWIEGTRRILSNEKLANGLTLRGFSTDPQLPQYENTFGLKAACIAVYPMYRGVSKLVGMDIINFTGEQPQDEFAAASSEWGSYDFFFIHIKRTDSKGEDGDFEGKVAVIEGVDQAIPMLLDLSPDVLLITGDHSTPARMRQHSWHPVPLLLWAPETARADEEKVFGETACRRGGLGSIPATSILPLLLAHSARLGKFGA
ncbi:MAG: 2,3-bisphosphoglycerate-independent phosphoglycerate mutase [Chloroflexi bacterium]|nr:2,3-bisphosphoglycerate-independent phosphoglycerate mutase [Chloroflexota bacterium]